ncbi:Capsule biosynthesis protein CapA [Lentibacillus sp. JNUCC-1]|uniref:CapA family protein n=1 Tax=Lentibacillus sp. JNUCC-1 TaxID=2654513 RepID=UPI0012E6FF47|nr:CapA family protein [Lentibacillus sp. JNUCC-1]MUV38476.1 Capsule biosynthesis protein CapA [Lentibacillus sp. JNUCC-1]
MAGILIVVLLLAACSETEEADPPKENAQGEQGSSGKKDPSNIPSESQPEPDEPDKIETEITLSAVGDMLIHKRVYDDARATKGFDFMPMLENVKPFLGDATITFANQETMIGGEKLGLSTYPRFNTPQAFGDTLKEVGVDVVSIANNHTLDRGEEAIQSAIQHWETIDMMYTGAYKDESDSEQLRIMETDAGISIAFLAYTYGTNGIPTPGGKDYLVNVIDQEAIAKDTARAKEQADVVVLSLHFGNEYERMPSDSQKQLVQFAADQGVDIVLGHHPHVLQPMEWVTGENGEKTLAVYSLGNFLSGQYDLYQRIGGIAQMTIKKTVEGEQETIEVTNPAFMPTFVKFKNDNDYEVTPMYQLTEADLAGAEDHYKAIKQHMSQWLPELEFIEGS